MQLYVIAQILGIHTDNNVLHIIVKHNKFNEIEAFNKSIIISY